jgi:hypothetical protein
MQTDDIHNLEVFGEGKLAFVKEMSAHDIAQLVPQALALDPATKLYALMNAQGMPIMVAHTRDDILMGAWEQDLETVTTH